MVTSKTSTTIMYTAEDGTEFTTEQGATAYEKNLAELKAAKDRAANKAVEDVIAKTAERNMDNGITDGNKLAEGLARVMDATGIAMLVYPKKMMETEAQTSIDKQFGLHGLCWEKAELQGNKEPKIEYKAEATFNISYMLAFLKMAKNRKYNYITIKLTSKEPICMEVGNGDSKLDEPNLLRYYLAPYMES